MYPALLANRYLATRIIPLIAVAAVGLCVALVIIVVSVMSGFLDMVLTSGRTLMGDVVVSYPVSGLPFYERLIERLEGREEVHAATPVVDGWGLLKMPYPPGDRKETEQVQFWAVEPRSFAAVTGYAETLWWRPVDGGDADGAEAAPDDYRRALADSPLGRDGLQRVLEDGLSLRWERPENAFGSAATGPATMPGVALGMHVSAGNDRQHDGTYRPLGGGSPARWWMPGYQVFLTAMPVTTAAVAPRPETAALRIVNEFVSGVFLIDDTRIILPLEVGQALLRLDGAALVDDEGVPTGLVDPPRATMVLVRGAEGVDPPALKRVVEEEYDAYWSQLFTDEGVSRRVLPPMANVGGVMVQTWREQQRRFIAPVEKERELMRALFSIVYLVCAGLVLAIFWAIVYEKTRDIGILRSVGASRTGIALIFIRYGAVIGVLGSMLGVALAFLVVHNINTIHDAMGNAAPKWSWISAYAIAGVGFVMAIVQMRRQRMLPVVLWILGAIVFGLLGVGLMLHRGTLLWDPAVYYFSVIPNRMDMGTAVSTMVGGVVFSVLGAFIPAVRAADTDPVQALRYE